MWNELKYVPFEAIKIERNLLSEGGVSDEIKKSPFILIHKGEGAQPLSFYGSALESIGTNSFVLAIGEKARTRELTPLVKDSEDVLSVKSFESLRSIIGRLAFYIAQRTIKNTGMSLNVRKRSHISVV